MMYIKKLSSLVLLGTLLAACAPAGSSPQPGVPAQETPVFQMPTSGDYPEAVQKARQALAAQLGIEPDDILVHAYNEAEWPDACLGLPGPEEACAEVITPGYGGVLVANDVQYEFRTDASGDSVRFIPGAALSARQMLAQQLHLTLDEIRIASAERVEWPDACLGVEIEGMMCAQVVTAGYRVVLEAGGQQYTYHTDEAGGTVMLAEAPAVDIEDVAIIWQQTDGICQTAQIGSQAVAFGTCGGALMTGKFAGEQRAAELVEFVETYAPFEAVTAAGSVTFHGQGARQASPAEQRMLAEWAHLVSIEAAGGRGGASYGLAIAWHREGGLAGFCDDLSVYVTGEVTAAACGSGQPQNLGSARLTTRQLEQVYTWIDSLQGFEIDHTDEAVADAMTIRLVFSGEGTRAASEAEQQAIQDFAAQLYTQFDQVAEPAGDQEQARQALEVYFAALNQGDYAAVENYYGGDYDHLAGMNPGIQASDHGALLEAACRYNGFQCNLQLKEILAVEQVSADAYRFTVEFAGPDGGTFEQGPCCGADPTSEPPVSQFTYTVVKRGERFLVQDLPVYIP